MLSDVLIIERSNLPAFSSPLARRTDGAVAQLGEHLLCKQGVVGSNPISSTNPLRPSRNAFGRRMVVNDPAANRESEATARQAVNAMEIAFSVGLRDRSVR